MNEEGRHDSDHTLHGRNHNEPVTTSKKQASSKSQQRGKLAGSASHLLRRTVTFFKETWLSFLVLVVMGAITAGVWVAPHAFNRLFPVVFFSGSNDIVWTQFAYPYTETIIGSAAAAMIAIFIPVGVILIGQFWVRSFCDASNAILGLAYSLVTGTFLVVIIKKTIGGLRPHFLSVCEPVLPEGLVGAGYQNIMFTIEQVCTGDKDKIGNAIESFPSGHSEIMFAGLFYLSIYLFTHLRIQSRYRVGYWRMVACVLPTLLATYIASTLQLTYNHHGYDIIFGVLLGVLVALLGYRMVFKSIWDKRLNAIPSCHDNHEEQGNILPK